MGQLTMLAVLAENLRILSNIQLLW